MAEFFLGVHGSVQKSFETISKAKRMVTVHLMSGKDVTGVPGPHPTDSYVVLRPDGGDDATNDVLVMYHAIATFTVNAQ